jgi:hypothetical protein
MAGQRPTVSMLESEASLRGSRALILAWCRLLSKHASGVATAIPIRPAVARSPVQARQQSEEERADAEPNQEWHQPAIAPASVPKE